MRIKKFNESSEDEKMDLQLVKDLVTNYLEDCKSFASTRVDYTTEISKQITLIIVFSNKCIQDRKNIFRDFRITENEIMDYWENLIDLFKVLKSNGFESNISYYQPTGVNMKIIIERKDEN
jgi:hypothetical protein